MIGVRVAPGAGKMDTTRKSADLKGLTTVSSPSKPQPRWKLAVISVPALFLLAGCADKVTMGWLPTEPGMTNLTDDIVALWNGSWIAALAVGVLVWGLILWCVIVYRKRKEDDQLPVQLRYHLPLELLYTFVPIMMVLVLFYQTVQVQQEITEITGEADVHVQVYGKQWTWDFNYLDEDVWDTGMPATFDGTMDAAEDLPTLYLPVDERVHFTINSRDVIHSFWVPAFLYKVDMVPGRTNEFEVVPQIEGTYLGKCAELCGELHGNMLFRVAVVDRPTYDAKMQELRDAGQTGILGPEYDRLGVTSGGTPSESTDPSVGEEE